MAVTLSYPKPRQIQTKCIAIARTDNATEKCVLPKDAIIVGVNVLQNVDAATDVGTVTVSCGSDTDGILNAFSMATTKVGYVAAGTAWGSAIGTKLTEDCVVKSTYTVGSSTAGGTGYVFIHYFMPGGNETITS